MLMLALTESATGQPVDEGDDRPNQQEVRDRIRNRDRGQGPEHHREHDGEKHQRRPRGRQQLPIDRIDEAIDTIRELHGGNPPPWMKKIEKAVDEKPEAVAKRLSSFPRIMQLMDARQNDPERFALHARHATNTRQLLKKVQGIRKAMKNGDEEKLAKLRPALRQHVEAIFEVRMEMKRLEIERQRKTVANAERELEKLVSEGPELINQKLKELEQGRLERRRPPSKPEGPSERSEHGDDRPRRERPHD